ncbi:MAG: OmpA family protein [Candidatus Omnitrophica bacterium]|nr:OmpA family protein [Candidatus Omnitrophota bacterium]
MVARSCRAIGIVICVAAFCGCSFVVQKGRRTDLDTINRLSGQVDELTQAQAVLEERLAREIQDKQVKLARAEKGLVITFVADILFDSGKATLRPESLPILDKVARVLNEEVAEYKVGIEGHTDNVPIKYSGWKSNWELSAQRALGVLQHLTEKAGVAPERLSAAAYGQYQPVSPNDTKAGRQQNRRVEIVIIPRISKVKDQAVSAEENLK